MKISKQWTPEERLQIVDTLLTFIQRDIYANRYSEIGRPNITTLQHIIHEPAEVLEGSRGTLENMLRNLQAEPDAQASVAAEDFPDPGFRGGPV